MKYPVKSIDKLKQLLLVAFISLSIMSCGSESIVSAGISGTGIVFGVITGFGSIFVNGVEYEIDDANFNVDGNTSANQSNLKIGMLVKLDATNNGDGTGNATSVSYDEAIEGPVSNLLITSDPEIITFQIFGTTVFINSSSTIFEGGSTFSNLQNNDLIEVSGFFNQSGNVIATLIEFKETLQQGSEVELHGQINNLNFNTFEIDGTNINYDGNTEIEDLVSGLQENLFVEVKGTYNSGSIDAIKIEGEDDDRDEIGESEGEINVQGIITDFTDSSSFSINGIPVQVDINQVPASVLSQLVLGLEIEVEGNISNGIIMADEIEIRMDERKYKARVSSVSATNLTVSIYYPGIPGQIELKVDNESELEDEITGDISLTDLNPEDEVEIEAKINGGDIRVKSLKRDIIDEYEISGVVEAFQEGFSITIEGLMLPLDAGVSLEPANLFDLINIGVTVVELEDEDKNSVFDEVEID